jgi:hypothetical protein
MFTFVLKGQMQWWVKLLVWHPSAWNQDSSCKLSGKSFLSFTAIPSPKKKKKKRKRKRLLSLSNVLENVVK